MSKAKCKNCGDIVESKHRHDWVSCKCFQRSDTQKVDFRITLEQSASAYGLDDNQVKGICSIFNKIVSSGFFIDGGNDYTRCGGCSEHIEWLQENDDE